MGTVRMIDIAVNFTDGMFKGIYNAKQYHLADIATVLSRAWSSGVDRIIVTGGSLEESKEALAIAETDGCVTCFSCSSSSSSFFSAALCWGLVVPFLEHMFLFIP
uniref:Uncharacterized protein MANES_09G044500 n=1 Tax=Rhizophora mucronata TaxID=61149 RepID=A0A2P2L3G3_RHIMU